MRPRLALALTIFCIALTSILMPGLARAQAATGTMNVERLRGSELEAGWAAQLSLNAAYATGNIESVNLGGSGALHYVRLFADPVEPASEADPDEPCEDPPKALVHARDHTFFAVSGGWARINESVWLNNAFAHLRHTHWFIPEFGFDAFAQIQHNDITALNRRILAGAGVRVDAIYERMGTLAFGTAYMAEWEENEIPAGGVHPVSPLNHRWTSYVTAHLELADGKLVISDTLYIQPRFDSFSDFRVLNEFDLQVAINDHFSLGLAVRVRHDSRPPDEVKPTDLQFTNSIRVSL
ncbi:MAG: DUF481 domain-containing protein [Polyangiales bacterium]